MQIPRELAPYFEFCFIFAFSICEECSKQAEFDSSHPRFSDEWWLDEATAMKNQGWVVPETQTAYCSECARAHGLAHDPTAYVIDIDNF